MTKQPEYWIMCANEVIGKFTTEDSAWAENDRQYDGKLSIFKVTKLRRSPMSQDWEKDFCRKFCYGGNDKANIRISTSAKEVLEFIKFLLASRTKREGLSEQSLIEAAQRFCRETYDMTGEKEEYQEKFGVLICFIKDVLIPCFSLPFEESKCHKVKD